MSFQRPGDSLGGFSEAIGPAGEIPHYSLLFEKSGFSECKSSLFVDTVRDSVVLAI